MLLALSAAYVLSFAANATLATQTAPAAQSESTQAVTAGTLGSVADFGALDLEMALVSDFAQLDLAALLDADVQTASKKSEPISKAPAIIEILTRQQLYELGARDLYSALTYLPGIEIVESYMGYTTFVFRGQLQEIYNSKLLLLINGHASYEVVNYTFYLEMIPLEAIDRIEVIRGPGSVMYGTNAFAGVINVITKTQQDDGQVTSVRAEGGSFSTGAFGAGNRGKRGDLGWSVYTSGNYSKGYPYRISEKQNEDCVAPMEGLTPKDTAPYCDGRDPSLELDYFNNYISALGEIRYQGLRFQSGSILQEKQKFGIIPAGRYSGSNSFQHVFADLGYRKEGSQWSISIRAGIDESARQWDIARFPLPTFQETSVDSIGRLIQAEMTSTWTPIDAWQFDLGINFARTSMSKFEIINKDGSLHFISPKLDFANPPYQASYSGFIQGTWRITEQLTAVAGGRASYFQSTRAAVKVDSAGVPRPEVAIDDPTTNYSPRGALVYAPRENLAFKVLYGAAFRNPTLYETTAVLNKIIGTVKGLQPETIRTAELGVDTRPIERLSLRVNGYYSLTGDIIARRAPKKEEIPLFGEQSTVYDNLSGQKIIGSELSISAPLSEEWRFFANAGLKQARSRQTNDIVREVPPLTASGGVSYKPYAWLVLKPNAQYVGPRKPSTYYALLNAVIDFPITNQLMVSAIGNNLLDKAYTYPEYIRPYTETLPGGPGVALYGRVLYEF